MAVGVEGHRDLRVAELLLDDHAVDAGLEERARAGGAGRLEAFRGATNEPEVVGLWWDLGTKCPDLPPSRQAVSP